MGWKWSRRAAGVQLAASEPVTLIVASTVIPSFRRRSDLSLQWRADTDGRCSCNHLAMSALRLESGQEPPCGAPRRAAAVDLEKEVAGAEKWRGRVELSSASRKSRGHCVEAAPH